MYLQDPAQKNIRRFVMNNTDDKKLKSVPLYEQETVIHYMRDEKFATIYTSDSTVITKIDKLCTQNPKMYSVIESDAYHRKYRVTDKSMVAFRAKKRKMTDEQRAVARDRFQKAREKSS